MRVYLGAKMFSHPSPSAAVNAKTPYLFIHIDDEDDENGWVLALREESMNMEKKAREAKPARQLVVYDDLCDELVELFTHAAPPPPATGWPDQGGMDRGSMMTEQTIQAARRRQEHLDNPGGMYEAYVGGRENFKRSRNARRMFRGEEGDSAMEDSRSKRARQN